MYLKVFSDSYAIKGEAVVFRDKEFVILWLCHSELLLESPKSQSLTKYNLTNGNVNGIYQYQ